MLTFTLLPKFLSFFLRCALICALFFSWLARTDPKDVARVESKTVIVTKSQRDTIPIPAGGVKSQLGSWMSEADWHRAREERFPGCMAGRSLHGNKMFVPCCPEMCVFYFHLKLLKCDTCASTRSFLMTNFPDV